MEAPIVFKGAMTLKVATGGITRTNVSRSTQDIDGDWVSPAPEMEDIEKILQRAVHNVNPNWTIQPFREFGEKRSAGFKVVDETGMARFHIDMSVRQNPYSKVYVVTNEETGTVCLQGASIEKMLADKISTISTQRVFRRSKDLIDLYILSKCTKFDASAVMKIAQERDMEDFSVFLTRQDDLKHAYDTLRNVENKPDFEKLYQRIKKFITPFIKNDVAEREWTGERWKHFTRENNLTR